MNVVINLGIYFVIISLFAGSFWLFFIGAILLLIAFFLSAFRTENYRQKRDAWYNDILKKTGRLN